MATNAADRECTAEQTDWCGGGIDAQRDGEQWGNDDAELGGSGTGSAKSGWVGCRQWA